MALADIRRRAAAIAAAVVLALPSPSPAAVSRPTGMLPDASNSELPDARSNLGLRIISVADYGARGDGTGDDSAAINAALQAARDNVGFQSYDIAVVLPGGKYRIASPINLTCFSDQTGGVDGCPTNALAPLRVISHGATIDCVVAGGTCIDGMGSSFVHLEGMLRIDGVCGASEPKYGLTIGRAAPDVGAPQWRIYGLNTGGCFSAAAYYNQSAENSSMFNSQLRNADSAAGGGAYVAILDSGNHWNIASTFIAISTPIDDSSSFIQNSFVDTSFVVPNGGTAGGVWLYGSGQIEFRNGYVSTGSGDCFTIWNDSSGASNAVPTGLYLDLHCEQTVGALVNDVVFASKNPATNISIWGLTYRNPIEMATGAMFALDANTSQVSFFDEDFRTGRISGAGPALFSDGTKFNTTRADRYSIAPNTDGWIPVVGTTCTGLGTGGTCELSTASNTGAGSFLLTAGASGAAASGSVTLTPPFDIGVNYRICHLDLANSTGVWDTGATVTQNTNGAGITVKWDNNGAALTAAAAYRIMYTCRGG